MRREVTPWDEMIVFRSLQRFLVCLCVFFFFPFFFGVLLCGYNFLLVHGVGGEMVFVCTRMCLCSVCEREGERGFG